jgi:hypothetical protein
MFQGFVLGLGDSAQYHLALAHGCKNAVGIFHHRISSTQQEKKIILNHLLVKNNHRNGRKWP